MLGLTYDDPLLTLLTENDPVGLATTCVYVTSEPSAFVEVPILVIIGGAETTDCPSVTNSVTDTGVEKVEKGWSVMVLVEVGVTSDCGAAILEG